MHTTVLEYPTYSVKSCPQSLRPLPILIFCSSLRLSKSYRILPNTLEWWNKTTQVAKADHVSQGFWVLGGCLEHRGEEGSGSQVRRWEWGIPTDYQRYLPMSLEWENADKKLPICYPCNRPLKIQLLPCPLSQVIGDPGHAKEQTVAGTGWAAEWS